MRPGFTHAHVKVICGRTPPYHMSLGNEMRILTMTPIPGPRPRLAFLAAGAILAVAIIPAGAAAQEIIVLTQTGCQFLEPEGTDRNFKTSKKADCEAINSKTGKDRLAKSRVLKLKPGKYIFRVTNRSVPYDLGFWLRSDDYDWRNPLHKLTKTSVSGGGLSSGKTQDYTVTLKPGKYLYSCPLNTTPDYSLEVSEL